MQKKVLIAIAILVGIGILIGVTDYYSKSHPNKNLANKNFSERITCKF